MPIKLALIWLILLALFASSPIHNSVSAQDATAISTSLATDGIAGESTATSTAAVTLVATASTDATAHGWIVQSTDTVPFAGGSAYLSPNGKYVFMLHTDDLCLFTVADKSQKCIKQSNYPYLAVADYSVVWSPDSQNIAFSDDFFRDLRKSYIWVLNVATMQPQNVTDDGKVEKFIVGDSTQQANNPKIDVSPRWSADSKMLYFWRCEAPCGPESPAVLYRIDRTAVNSSSNSAAQKVAALDQPLAWLYNFDVAKDGKSLVYLVSSPDTANPLNGIWQLRSDGGALTHLAVVNQLLNIFYSADQKYVLAYSPMVESDTSLFTAKTLVAHRIVDLSNAAVLRIDPTRNGYFPGWGPDGAEYAYLNIDLKQNAGLYLVNKPGDVGQLVYTDTLLSVPTTWRGLQWTQDNMIMVYQSQKRALLLLHLVPNK